MEQLNFSRIYANVNPADNGVSITYRGLEGDRKSVVFEQKESETDQQFIDRVMNEYQSIFITPIRNAVTAHKADVESVITQSLIEEEEETENEDTE